MLDIHAHLYWDSYDADRDEVVKRAFDAGIERMICVGTEPGDNPKALAVAERYDHVFASVGLHPHFFNEIGEEVYRISNTVYRGGSDIRDTEYDIQPEAIERISVVSRELKKLAQSSTKVVAIGECGLDYFSRNPEQPVTEAMKAVQESGFLAQIGIARELGVPLIIHTRPSAGTMDAYEDVLDLLKAESYKPKAILHCYQGDTEMTGRFLELPDVWFSFAGSITYPVKKALVGTKDDPAEVVKLVPLERLFVETDAPFLAPAPHRGERNEPAYARATADRVCELKGCTREELDQALRTSFERVFDK